MRRHGTDHPSCQRARNREILRLHDACGLSYREIAERYGMTKGRAQQIARDERLRQEEGR